MSKDMRITETAKIIISMGEKIDRLEEENEQLKAIIALYGVKDIVKEQREELVDLGLIDERVKYVKELVAKYPLTPPDYDLRINLETGTISKVSSEFEFSPEDRQKLHDAFDTALKSMEVYDPYSIGYKLFENGHGISSIACAVKCDADMNECQRGYDDALALWRRNNE